MASSQPQSVLSLGATLGEGPCWVERDSSLWFVDIKAHNIHRFVPGTGALVTWRAPAQVGWILPADNGRFVVGLQTGLHHFDPETADFSAMVDPEPEHPRNRLNDATVDRHGRLWFGTMDDDEEGASGRVFLFADNACRNTGIVPVSITNGPAVSADTGLLYHVDTLGRKIWRSRIEADGAVHSPELFISIEENAGYPDGPTIDAEGCLWIGLFGGWGARRYDPDGRLMAHIPFPVANVTKIAFGGDDLATAYATTARKGLSPENLKHQHQAGDLFAFDPGTRGLPGHHVRLG
ncbi:SMP-30/gluconolactonase/LRE family protein [Sphingomonas sp.]|uniref:SMP-30/gluconolactonase/LRE family protein n=1 Tax=Sphingomonas sp. TaxID=28214 RepID=UPI000DB5E5AB|nr:SMP-30/gluconolactonase/LRE family protein [Sphingomonas sp.]PZU08796.1 MAG: gluconolaconase [Sphingomonas sp.]